MQTPGAIPRVLRVQTRLLRATGLRTLASTGEPPRLEKVQEGKLLLDDPGYPSSAIIQALAHRLAAWMRHEDFSADDFEHDCED